VGSTGWVSNSYINPIHTTSKGICQRKVDTLSISRRTGITNQMHDADPGQRGSFGIVMTERQKIAQTVLFERCRLASTDSVRETNAQLKLTKVAMKQRVSGLSVSQSVMFVLINSKSVRPVIVAVAVYINNARSRHTYIHAVFMSIHYSRDHLHPYGCLKDVNNK